MTVKTYRVTSQITIKGRIYPAGSIVRVHNQEEAVDLERRFPRSLSVRPFKGWPRRETVEPPTTTPQPADNGGYPGHPDPSPGRRGARRVATTENPVPEEGK